jgi:hypothetical protein
LIGLTALPRQPKPFIAAFVGVVAKAAMTNLVVSSSRHASNSSREGASIGLTNRSGVASA